MTRVFLISPASTDSQRYYTGFNSYKHKFYDVDSLRRHISLTADII